MKAKTLKFFRNGTENQTKADISFDIKRVDAKRIQKWSTSQKLLARAFLIDIENNFNDFKESLLKLL